MKFRHWVKVFSDSGIFEGVFIPPQSDEYNLAVDLPDGTTFRIPWEMISQATFLPEQILEKMGEEKQPKQLILVGV